MTPAERLRAAAERLETLVDEGTSAPWTLRDPDPWGADLEVRGPYDILVAARVARPDGRLITALRPLAPILVAALREEAEPANADPGTIQIHTLVIADSPLLTLADAVLAATGGAS